MTEISSGQWKHTNLSAGDGLLATYDGNGLHYHLADWLGTNRVQTDRHGNIEETCTNQPFGDNQQCSGSSLEATELHFTGKERDTESGLDFFGARYYSGGMGRFMNPDWADKPEAVPYATLTNPQTLNLYAYVGNSPIGRADRDGHIYNGSADSSGDPDSSWYNDAVRRDAKQKDALVQQQHPPTPPKPLTAKQIKRGFYHSSLGRAFDAAVKKAFGRDASRLPAQDLSNAPNLDISRDTQRLTADKGTGGQVVGDNKPDFSRYPSAPALAQNGTIFISSDVVKSGDLHEIYITYAHELANLLDAQVNGMRGSERNYGDPNDPHDNDTGQRVEKILSPQ